VDAALGCASTLDGDLNTIPTSYRPYRTIADIEYATAGLGNPRAVRTDTRRRHLSQAAPGGQRF
jgi:hypothetical protein